MPTNDDNDTILYEVDLEADAAIEGPFDTWLRNHVADMLQLEGFFFAGILADAAPAPGACDASSGAACATSRHSTATCAITRRELELARMGCAMPAGAS